VATGRQIKLYLAEGTPGGLTTAEIMNWTGHVVAASRSDLAQLLMRDEPKRTGVYVLLGEVADSEVVNTRALYVGEGDDISRRLRQHAKAEEQGGKDFWDRVLILTSKDANLTKAHARYLEARLLEMAQAAGRAQVTNTQNPEPALLPEADISDMEYYLAQVLTVLPVLGVHDFRKPASLATQQANAALTPAA
jgi:predicted GIY-YIG superfamily endonuclease